MLLNLSIRWSVRMINDYDYDYDYQRMESMSIGATSGGGQRLPAGISLHCECMVNPSSPASNGAEPGGEG